MKKYKLTNEEIRVGGKKLRRIQALKTFGRVHAGDIGGFVEGEQNLSHEGKAWVCGNAVICDNAVVCGNAVASGDAAVCDDAGAGAD